MSYFYDSRESQFDGLLCNDDFKGELVELTELDEEELAGVRLLMNWMNEHTNACGPGPTEPIPNLVLTDELTKKIRKDYKRICEETQPLLDALEESKYIDPRIWDLPIDICKLRDEMLINEMQDEIGHHIGNIIRESCQEKDKIMGDNKDNKWVVNFPDEDHRKAWHGLLDRMNKSVETGARVRTPKSTLIKPLSKEAQEARMPLPPDVLVGALQDKIHTEPGRSRLAKTVRTKRKLSESINKTDFEKSDK